MDKGRRRRLSLGVVAAIGVLTLAAGCAGSSSPSSTGAVMPQVEGTAPALSTTIPPAPAGQAAGGGGASADAVPVAQADVILSGSMTVLVGRGGIGHAFQSASDEATSAGGFVASSNSQLTGTSNPYADLVLRVPASRFDEVTSDLGGLGKVQQQQLQGQDVTGQVVDLGARIDNLQSEESALRQLMARTGSIPDILTVENQLFSVEQQIEQLTAQKNSLADQVAYATLTLDLVTPAPPAKPSPRPTNAVLHGSRIALHNTAAALHSVALVIGEAFPALVVASAAGLVLWLRRRRWSRRGAGAPATSPLS
jgi:Ca-activated chloride channel family protein